MCQSKKREKQIIIKNGPSEGCSSYCSFLLLTVIPKIHKWTGMKNLLLTMHSNSQPLTYLICLWEPQKLYGCKLNIGTNVSFTTLVAISLK